MSSEQNWNWKNVFDKAEQYALEYNHELAIRFYSKALEMNPKATPVMDSFGSVLLEIGRVKDAHNLLKRSISLAPNSGYLKYMNMGQIYQGHESLQYYQKGIEILLKLYQQTTQNTTTRSASSSMVSSSSSSSNQPSAQHLAELISTAYVSCAEIYLTDACLDDDAESQCEKFLKKALSFDKNNTEALQTYGSFKISQNQNNEALKLVQRSYDTWKDNDDENTWPPYEVRLNLAQLFVELEQNESAQEILELLTEEDETNMETWDLLVISYQFANNFQDAQDSLNQATQVMQKLIQQRASDQALVQCLLKEWKPRFDQLQEELNQQNSKKTRNTMADDD